MDTFRFLWRQRIRKEDRYDLHDRSAAYVPRCEGGAYHGPAPIPEEGKWVQAKQIADISGFTHGIGWCAPQQGACKLTLNVKDGVIRGGAGRDHRLLGHDPFRGHGSREILIGKTHARGAEHRPCVRRHQHRHARAVPADRLRPHPVRLLGGRPGSRRRPSRISARVPDAPRSAPCIATKAEKGPRYLETRRGLHAPDVASR